MATVHLTRFGKLEGVVYSTVTCETRSAHDDELRFELIAGENAETLIPVGEYDLVPDDTGRHRWWVILGGALGRPGDGTPSEQVELHAGNGPAVDSRGCPIIGRAIGVVGHLRLPGRRLGIIDSVPGLAQMRTVLGSSAAHKLNVRDLRAIGG